MKELSIEEKAKRYDVAIERAKAYQGLRSEMEIIFPELKESGDFKIRRELLSFLNERSDDYYIPTSWIAYLEKQVEQETVSKVKIGEKYRCSNSVRYTCFQIGKVYEVKDSFDAAMISLCSDCFVLVDDSIEQKPANKVEPKFKKGDWVVCNNGSHPIFQVIERSWPNAKYRDIKGTEIFLNVKTLEKQYHLWTIQDAKDGDVLFTSSTASHETFIFKSIDEKGNAKCYFTYDSEDGFREGKYHFIGRATNCKPATKEQRDFLFQKMHEKGYEWDAEKKELRKIEQKSADITDEWIEEYWQHEKVNNPYSYNKGDEIQFDYQGFVNFCKKYCQNPAWSEEEVEIIDWLVASFDCLKIPTDTFYQSKVRPFLISLRNKIQPIINEWSEEDELAQAKKDAYNHALDKIEYHSGEPTFDDGWSAAIDYIQKKSLRPQSTWRPSDEQLKVLVWCMPLFYDPKSKDILKSLINDLKKLKNE